MITLSIAFFIACKASKHQLTKMFFLSLLLLVFGVSVGCSGGKDDGPATYPVSGTVTFDGTPVESGRIQFRSSDDKGKAYSTEIKAGSFKFKTEAGEMKVEITASREVPGKFGETASPDEEPQPLYEMYIPEIYNQESTLKETVKADGENEFTFELKSGK